MSNIFKGQGYLTITLDTGINISTATTTNIKYKKPDGSSGSFTGSLSGTTKITYQCDDSSLDMAGYWDFQSHVVIGGVTAFGNPASVLVEETL